MRKFLENFRLFARAVSSSQSVARRRKMSELHSTTAPLLKKVGGIPHMLTEWRPIVSFPGYSVSDTGLVRNDEVDRIMTLMRNQFGIVHVGLTKDRHQYKRAVCRLVADAFLVPPRHETFDTPINLDGDRCNNHVENLLWRPRHFATRYFAQFKLGPIQPSYGVVEVNTGQEFESSWGAALTYGLIETDVRVASRINSEVWPTYQRFRRI